MAESRTGLVALTGDAGPGSRSSTSLANLMRSTKIWFSAQVSFTPAQRRDWMAAREIASASRTEELHRRLSYINALFSQPMADRQTISRRHAVLDRNNRQFDSSFFGEEFPIGGRRREWLEWSRRNGRAVFRSPHHSVRCARRSANTLPMVHAGSQAQERKGSSSERRRRRISLPSLR